ncbi:MAG TPA: MFS transporter, partial [Sphingobium sp.]|nr:MFS transporter [Sphingobium sp.]
LLQWFAMFAYWQFIAFAIARSIFETADPASSSFRQAVLLTGQAGALYNAIACLAAFAMVPISRRIGPHYLHAVAVTLSGASMLAIPGAAEPSHLFLLMAGIGIGWASMMGNPYVMLANAIPPERTGIYMGIFNMFIVIPMLLETLIVPIIYRPLLGNDPRNILLMCGMMMIAAGIATLIVKIPRRT